MQVEQRRRIWGLVIAVAGLGLSGLAVQAYRTANPAMLEVAHAIASVSPEEESDDSETAPRTAEPVAAAADMGESFVRHVVAHSQSLYAAKVDVWGPSGPHDADDFNRFVRGVLLGLAGVGVGVTLFGIYNFRRRSDQL